MKNSPLISQQSHDQDHWRARMDSFYTLISGEDRDKQSTPLRAAMTLEDSSSSQGWPEGRILGSERELAARLRVSRETLREAIRIAERRGSLRMLRGRGGGLAVTRPTLDQVATALATYLRAIGCRRDQIIELTGVITPMREAVTLRGGREPALTLFAAAASILLRDDTGPGDGGAPPQPPRDPQLFHAGFARGTRVARQILERTAQAPAMASRRLGTEWDLGDSYQASRAVIRQSLRMLADLDMIETRRGRGGGVFLKTPSPAGITRQVFPYLAAAGVTPASQTGLMWELLVAHLRLAAGRIAALDAGARTRCCDSLDRLLGGTAEPHRWVLLQQALVEIVGNPAIDTLARCIVAFQARLTPAIPSLPEGYDARLLGLERGIVTGLRMGDEEAAVRMHRATQQQMSEFMATWHTGTRASS